MRSQAFQLSTVEVRVTPDVVIGIYLLLILVGALMFILIIYDVV